MSSVTITMPPGLKRLLEKGAPAVVLPAIARALDDQNELTIGAAVKTRMSFSENQKPTPEGTRVITGHLRRSLKRSLARIQGTTVESAIGSNVRYFGTLEAGGTESVKAHTRTGQRRFSLGDGSTASLGIVNRLGGLTKKGTVRRSFAIRELDRGTQKVRAHSRTYKARRMVGLTIEARMAAYGAAMQTKVAFALAGGAP